MSKVLIIAEAGVNHNGKLEIAKELALKAKECGADIVKFQTANVSDLVTKQAEMASYQKTNTGKDMGQKELLEEIMLSYEEFEELAKYCDSIGITFLSTPFDIDSISFLEMIGCKTWKIPSGEITNYPYLKYIAKTGKKVIMSTGMSDIEEVEQAFSILKQNGIKDISLMHCTTEYPAPLADVNLNAINTLKEKFGCNVGYSDHTEGIIVPIAAVAMGASIIEKHLTLDRNMKGPDHKASLEPNEFKEMVCAIRDIEIALGDGNKRAMPSEQKNKDIARKSIVASKEIKTGELFTEDNITTKRPGNGLSPMKWPEVIGRKATRDYIVDDFIEL